DRRNAAVAQPVEPAALRGRGVLPILALAHDHAAGVDAIRLHRPSRDPVVPDQWIGEGDDLPRVARVGHRLLIARHRGVEDDLAGHLPAGAEQVTVQAGAVLEQDVAAHSTGSGLGAYSRISFWTRLNSSVPARPSNSKSAVSTLVTWAPARVIFSSPTRLFRSVREATASSATCTSTPESSRSCVVWLTQTWVSIPQTSAWSRPPRSKPSASLAEKTTFSSGSVPAGSWPATSGTVSPSPSGYCSVTTTGTPRASAPWTIVAVPSVTR